METITSWRNHVNFNKKKYQCKNISTKKKQLRIMINSLFQNFVFCTNLRSFLIDISAHWNLFDQAMGKVANTELNQCLSFFHPAILNAN